MTRDLPETALQPVGIVHSCFKEKFGVPRQPGLVKSARATLELLPPYNRPEALAGLEDFSHLWLIFVFHRVPDAAAPDGDAYPTPATETGARHGEVDAQARLTVRPPRLGGNRKVGVFASRAPYRPNRLGLSLVGLDAVVCENGQCRLALSGVDLVDGTPVLDIKPYLPDIEALPQARAGYTEAVENVVYQVEFTPQAAAQCDAAEAQFPGLHTLISELLGLDPRPGYLSPRAVQGESQRDTRRDTHGVGEERVFGMRLHDVDVRWQVRGQQVLVLELVSS